MTTSPYISTKLFTSIGLRPDQMDNKVYINLKKNLEGKLLQRCYKNYGYISNIYKILEYNDGEIEAENLKASAIFEISFSCKLCRPLLKTQIVCKIERVNKLLLTATNGPIHVIVTNDRMSDSFFTDHNNILRYKKDGVSKILNPKDFVKITLLSITFSHNDTVIKSIGQLEDVASTEEITKFYNDEYGVDMDHVEFEDYIKNAE